MSPQGVYGCLGEAKARIRVARGMGVCACDVRERVTKHEGDKGVGRSAWSVKLVRVVMAD